MFPIHEITDAEGNRTLTVLLPPDPVPVVIGGTHPNYDAVKAAAQTEGVDADEVRDLADLAQAVERKFQRLSERVSVGGGRLFFDGDPVDGSIESHVLRCLDDPTVGDWRPLVRFMENVAANPVAHSREQLFAWIAAREGITITADGLLVGYKGVGLDHEDGGRFLSGFSGTALVNGEQRTGRIAQAEGDVVEMPRTSVRHDPASACSTGLHVGTFTYAKGYAQGALLRVLVNPRDVVSVPTDAAGEKVRVCRYRILDVIDAPDTRPVAYDLYEDEPEYEDECECGDALSSECECGW